MLRHGGSQTGVRCGNRIISRATRNALLKQPQLLYWFAAFFAFGAMMCLLTIVLLVFPGTKLDSLWNLNPDAHVAFQSLGSWSVLLMLAVGDWMRFGSNRPVVWEAVGAPLAIAILFINIIGDLVNVVIRHDYRPLIGVPIAGVMIFYVARFRTRRKAH